MVSALISFFRFSQEVERSWLLIENSFNSFVNRVGHSNPVLVSYIIHIVYIDYSAFNLFRIFSFNGKTYIFMYSLILKSMKECNPSYIIFILVNRSCCITGIPFSGFILVEASLIIVPSFGNIFICIWMCCYFAFKHQCCNFLSQFNVIWTQERSGCDS